MNKQKHHIEILKKRNIILSNQLEETRKKLQDIDSEKIVPLIDEIEQLRTQFIEAIEDLNRAKKRYNTLNQELIEIKQNFQIFRIPWYRKLFINIRKK